MPGAAPRFKTMGVRHTKLPGAKLERFQSYGGPAEITESGAPDEPAGRSCM